MKRPWRVGLDFDGTLIDTRKRHEMALCRAAEAVGVQLPEGFPANYYDQKCSGSSGKQVLLRNGIPKAREIAENWIRIIEDDELLLLDVPFPLVLDKLGQLIKERIEFFVCTSRQYPDRALRQFTDFGFQELVKEILVTGPQQIGGAVSSKAALTKCLGLRVVVGDSEADAEWAAGRNVRFVAVSCGARSSGFWEQRGVVHHVKTVTALEQVLDVLRTEKDRQG